MVTKVAWSLRVMYQISVHYTVSSEHITKNSDFKCIDKLWMILKVTKEIIHAYALVFSLGVPTFKYQFFHLHISKITEV